MTAAEEAQLLELIELGQAPTRAAINLGFAPQIVPVRSKRHGDFADRIERARAKFEERKLRAIDGSPDWRAHAYRLEKALPDIYGTRKDPIANLKVTTTANGTTTTVESGPPVPATQDLLVGIAKLSALASEVVASTP